MATAEEYEKVLVKAELRGLGALNPSEKEMLKRLLKETSSRGNRARSLLNG